MPRAMREVAALDRQILAHLEIHRATGLERAVAARLRDGAGPVFDGMARLLRRRYPLFALAGALAGIALVAIGLGRPTDADRWLAITLAGAAAVAVLLARATTQPAIELPRATATLPIAPAAVATARRAAVALWLGWWLTAPVAIAIAASPSPARTALWLAAGAAAGAALRPRCADAEPPRLSPRWRARTRAATARRRRRRGRSGADRTGRSPRCNGRDRRWR